MPTELIMQWNLIDTDLRNAVISSSTCTATRRRAIGQSEPEELTLTDEPDLQCLITHNIYLFLLKYIIRKAEDLKKCLKNWISKDSIYYMIFLKNIHSLIKKEYIK